MTMLVQLAIILQFQNILYRVNYVVWQSTCTDNSHDLNTITCKHTNTAKHIFRASLIKAFTQRDDPPCIQRSAIL